MLTVAAEPPFALFPVPPDRRMEDGVHSLHPYPAKFPASLAGNILSRFARPGDMVLDPFCGSGTTIVEARLRGMRAVGVDINGLACLVSKVKATPLTNADFAEVRLALTKVRGMVNSPNCAEKKTPPDFAKLDHWFQDNVVQEISALLSVVTKCKSGVVRDFLRVVLSSIIVRVSNQESDTRYAAIDKNIGDLFTMNLFVKKTTEAAERMRVFSRRAGNSSVAVHNADSRRLSFIASESADCIVTSPPYANTYDYYLYHKFRCVWLGLDFRSAQNGEIGSRREFSSLKKSPEKWGEDLRACLLEMWRILKRGKPAFIVIGDSIIAGARIDGGDLVASIAGRVGFKVCGVESSSQAGHSKSFNPSFARKGKQEHLVHLMRDD